VGALVRKRLYPLVTRKRFVRELESQRKAFQANQTLTEGELRHQHQMRMREQREFQEWIFRLTSWPIENGHAHIIATAENEPVTIKLQTFPDLYYDRLTFQAHVSGSLWAHVHDRLSEEEFSKLSYMVANSLASQMVSQELAK
jgi:hypothetical protein